MGHFPKTGYDGKARLNVEEAHTKFNEVLEKQGLVNIQLKGTKSWIYGKKCDTYLGGLRIFWKGLLFWKLVAFLYPSDIEVMK